MKKSNEKINDVINKKLDLIPQINIEKKYRRVEGCTCDRCNPNPCDVSECSGICKPCIFDIECDNILRFMCDRYIKKYEYKNGFYTDSPYLPCQNSFKVNILKKDRCNYIYSAKSS